MSTPSVTPNQIIQLVVQGMLGLTVLQSSSEYLKMAALVCAGLLAVAVVISDAIIRNGRSRHLPTDPVSE
jgi:heme/copper-type cytochrome/quinol oxidase subunit 4